MMCRIYFSFIILMFLGETLSAQTQQLTPVDSFSAADEGKYPGPNTFILAEKEPTAVNLDEFKSALVLPQNLSAEKPTKVLLRVLVDTGGRVVRYSFLKRENKEVEEAVVAKLSVLRYSAAIKDSKPIVDWATLSLKFAAQIQPPDTNNYPEPLSFVAVDEEAQPINLSEVYERLIAPPIFTEANLQAKVNIRVLTDQNGSLIKWIILKSIHPKLTQIVVEHLREIKFTPALKNKKRISSWTTIPIVFKPSSNVVNSGTNYLLAKKYPKILNIDEFFDVIKKSKFLPNESLKFQIYFLVDSNGAMAKNIITNLSDTSFYKEVEKALSILRFEPESKFGKNINSWTFQTVDIIQDKNPSQTQEPLIQYYFDKAGKVHEEEEPVCINFSQFTDGLRYPPFKKKDNFKLNGVFLRALINTAGKPTESKITFSSDTSFTKEVLSHLNDLNYLPGKIDGIVAPTWVNIQVVYNLPNFKKH